MPVLRVCRQQLILKKPDIMLLYLEKQSTAGGSRHGDYEGLDNWIFQQFNGGIFLLHMD